MANMLQNPSLTDQQIWVTPGLTLGRGATKVNSRVVFDGNQTAPFASFAFEQAPTNGHAYSVTLPPFNVTGGSIHFTTNGSVPSNLGTYTESTTEDTTVYFTAQGDEDAVVCTGSLHSAAAAFDCPNVEE